MTKKTYHVSLTAEILARIRIDDDCPDDVLETIACESISLSFTGQEDVSLELEHIEVSDIIEITQEANNAR